MVRQRSVSQVATMPVQVTSTPALPVVPATVASLAQHQVLSVPQRAIYCARDPTHFAGGMMEAPPIVRRISTMQVEFLHVKLRRQQLQRVLPRQRHQAPRARPQQVS